MADWFVSDKVSSSGVGNSLSTAFKTIAEAITASSSTDTIYVYPGIYNESATMKQGVNIFGVGMPVLDGGLSLNRGFIFNKTCILKGFIVRNFLIDQIYINDVSDSKTLDMHYCYIIGRVYHKAYYSYINMTYNIILGDYYFRPFSGTGRANIPRKAIFKNNTFYGNADLHVNSPIEQLTKNNTFKNGSYVRILNAINNLDSALIYCNIDENVNISFNDTVDIPSFSLVSTIGDIKNKFFSDTGLTAVLNQFDSVTFHEVSYNNISKGDYTLKYSNEIAFASFDGRNLGATEAAVNWEMRTDDFGGDAEKYNISTDFYSLGIFAGITNVGNVSNGNERLERTTDGLNNWGVFILKGKQFPRAHKIKNFRAFGTIIDRNGGQFSRKPSDFVYNYQIDVLVAWSATQTDSQLEADSSATFVRFRLRKNDEKNYYVDNAGTLVGDGDPTYLSLVDSTDGGSGSLPPLQVTALSMMAIVILRDA